VFNIAQSFFIDEPDCLILSAKELIDYILKRICSAVSFESSQVPDLLMKRVLQIDMHFNNLSNVATRTAALNNS